MDQSNKLKFQLSKAVSDKQNWVLNKELLQLPLDDSLQEFDIEPALPSWMHFDESDEELPPPPVEDLITPAKPDAKTKQKWKKSVSTGGRRRMSLKDPSSVKSVRSMNLSTISSQPAWLMESGKSVGGKSEVPLASSGQVKQLTSISSLAASAAAARKGQRSPTTIPECLTPVSKTPSLPDLKTLVAISRKVSGQRRKLDLQSII